MHRNAARHLAFAALLACSATACQLNAAAPDPKRPAPAVRASEAPRQASPTPGAAATSTPSPAGLAKLAAPSAPTTRLVGDVKLDATYLVAQGAGAILSHNGGLIVAAGGLNLIGADGASLVAAGAGNVISHNGGLALGPTGGQLVGADGATLVGADGASYALAQAPAMPPVGALTAVAGLELRVFELASGKPVAVGEDAQGQPVYGVLTDAAGHYELFLPAGLAGNALVQARVPGHADARLAYDLVTTPGATLAFAQAVDEDTAIVTRYLRRAFARRLEAVLASAGDEQAIVKALLAGTEATPELAAIAGGTLQAFRARVAEAGIPAARHPEVAARVTDVLIGRAALADITLDVTNTAWKGDAGEPALDAMRAILKSMRTAAATRLASAGPESFDAQPYVKQANALRPAGAPALRVLKAADVGELLVEAYLSQGDVKNLQRVVEAFYTLGIPYTEADRLFAAASGIGLRLGTAFLADPEARTAVAAAIDAAK